VAHAPPTHFYIWATRTSARQRAPLVAMTSLIFKIARVVQIFAFAAPGGVRPAVAVSFSPAASANQALANARKALNAVNPEPMFLAGEVQGHMDTSTVKYNNLGGMGPEFDDPPVLEFENCATVGDKSLSLVIRNTTEYIPNKAYRNGHGADDEYPFGLLNVACGTEVGLTYSFVETTSQEPVRLETLWFTFMDLDTGNRGEVKESIGIDGEIKSVHLYPDSELEEIPHVGGRAWQATVPGTGKDNPTDPMHLTKLQKERTITLELEDVTHVQVTLALTTRNDGTCPSDTGRNFIWAFKSLLIIKCSTCVLNDQGIPTCCAEGASWHGLCGSATQLAKGTRFYSYDEGVDVCVTPSPTPQPTKAQRTPSPTTPGPTASDTSCATCVIWGDPHIITFEAYKRRKASHPLREEFFRTREWKSDQITINEAGTFWLVNSEHLQVQGLYERDEAQNMTSLVALAIGGPVLAGNVLAIRPLGSVSLWNGEEILSSVESEFHNSLVSARSHTAGKMVKDGTHGPAVDVQLPMGVSLVVNRWHNSMAAEISICPEETVQGINGQCALHTGAD